VEGDSSNGPRPLRRNVLALPNLVILFQHLSIMRERNNIFSASDEACSLRGKKIKLSVNSPVSKTLVRELEHLLGAVPVHRLSRGLRDLYLHYASSSEDVVSNRFVRDLSGDLYILFQFLDVAVEESQRKQDR